MSSGKKWLIIIPAIISPSPPASSASRASKWDIDAHPPQQILCPNRQGLFEEVLVADPRQIAGQINQNSFNTLIASELNLNLREFPRISAQNLRDTNLVRVIIRDTDVAKAKSVLRKLFDHIKTRLDKKIDVEVKTIDSKITTNEREIKDRTRHRNSKVQNEAADIFGREQA
jgi:hypothetical protein